MAKEYKLEADISAVWIGIPAYRIWVDGELMCERSFWPDPDKNIIRETVVLALEDGEHEMVLEQVDAGLGSSWVDKILITDLADNTSRLFTYGANNSLKQHLHFSLGDQGITR